jgi:hypothetical protein
LTWSLYGNNPTTLQGMNFISPMLYASLSKWWTCSLQCYMHHSSWDGLDLLKTITSLSKGMVWDLPSVICTNGCDLLRTTTLFSKWWIKDLPSIIVTSSNHHFSRGALMPQKKKTQWTRYGKQVFLHVFAYKYYKAWKVTDKPKFI